MLFQVYRVAWNEVWKLEWVKKTNILHRSTLTLSGYGIWISHFDIERSQNPCEDALRIGYICLKNGCICIIS